jgi:prolipoprotein diacylglyceryltransferase
MGQKTPSAPWVFSLAPSLGTLCSVQWMAVSFHLGICQALSGPLRRQLYQAPVSKLLLASTVVSGFGGCLWCGRLWMVIPSVSVHTLSL